MITEVFIENYQLDISEDISSLLTLAIDDVKDFASRSTSFSKTIVLPGTAKNNALFGNIFEVGISNEYDSTLPNVKYNFNASVSAHCVIFQNSIQSFKGVMQLNKIILDKGRIEYEVAVFGDLRGLNVALTSSLLESLDFSAYDHTYSVANIIASWDNAGGSGYYYPNIDYGTYSTDKHSWKYKGFRPALYVKEYLDKMFEAANYRYDSDLIDTARFKSLVVPHNSKVFQRPDSFKLNVSDSTQHYLNTDGVQWPVEFPTQPVLTDFTPDPFNEVFVYGSATPFSGTVTFSTGGTFTKSSTDPFTAQLLVNGAIVATQQFGSGLTSGGYGITLTYSGTLNNTDYIQVFIVKPASGGTWDLILFPTLTARSVNDALVDIALGDQVPLNLTIPKNIRQIDFLVSIVKLFNLYVYEDRFDSRLIYIKPYVDFYSTDSSNAVDWTYKLNRDSPITVKPMSELNSKIYEFKFKSDSDYYNDLYRKRYGKGYGDYIFDSTYEFAQQTSSFELIFSATPLVGYGGEEKVYPTIFKMSNAVEETTDSNIRILQTKKVTGVASWDILDDDGVTVLDSVTDYGYAGHFDDPDAPTNDLNFGVPEELFFSLAGGDLTATQFNVYWSAYMSEITNKDSKLLTAKFYLTPQDIFALDFSKYVHVDGDIFRLNKITDFNLTKPSDCEVRLLKVIYTIY